jgi:hypothetical protein
MESPGTVALLNETFFSSFVLGVFMERAFAFGITPDLRRLLFWGDMA